MMYRRETPAIKHMPRRMGIKTSEVPKSGWTRIIIIGTSTIKQEPTKRTKVLCFRRVLSRYQARKRMVVILAISETWKPKAPILSHRVPGTVQPNIMVYRSNISVPRYRYTDKSYMRR
jgi:hypothetical protein